MAATDATKATQKTSELSSQSSEISFPQTNDSYSFSFEKYYNKNKNGCGSLVVRIFGCGPMDLGSIPGRGPLSFLLKKEKLSSQKKIGFKGKRIELNNSKNNGFLVLPGKSLCASFASGGGDAWAPKGRCSTYFEKGLVV